MIQTVDNVKVYLNLADDNTETNNFISGLITAMQKQIENYINYPLEVQSKEVEFKFNDDYEKYIFREHPINSITSLQYKSDLFASYKLIESENYTLQKENTNSYLYLKNNFIANYMYKLIYNFGYTTAPTDLVQVLTEMVSRAYTESAIGGDLSLGLTARSMNLDKYAQNIVFTESLSTRWNKILSKYRRY